MPNKRKPKPTRARTLLRQAARTLDKLATQRTRLAALEPGGSELNPIGVESSSVIEGKATQSRCASCDDALVVAAHDAVVVAGRRLRRVGMRCKRCGVERTLWFQIEGALLN